MSDNPYRKLPAVNDVIAALADLPSSYSADAVTQAVRDELARARQDIAAGKDPAGLDAVAAAVRERLSALLRPKLVPVINATGIVLHTNLGRAPMCREAAEAAMRAAGGYLNLELDLATGKRSSRQDAIREWVTRLTGAEGATVVNNNAAATIIVLRAVAAGKEVILSRGQLVEIGGSFRIPDILTVSGCVLREVGTTNITRVRDYENAVNERTGAIMLIHTSNYRVTGFTETPGIAELVELGKRRGVPVIDDIGSGALVDYAAMGYPGEPVASASIAAGADLILFSGDKLLGGPQAGIIAGRKEWISRIEKDPMMRAFRLDKMTLAALEATLRVYVRGGSVRETIPVLRLLTLPPEELQRRAWSLADKLSARGISARAAEDVSYVGGGSLPDVKVPTWVVEVRHPAHSEEELSRRLRTGTPAVMGRLRDGVLVLDVRTLMAGEEAAVVEAVATA